MKNSEYLSIKLCYPAEDIFNKFNKTMIWNGDFCRLFKFNESFLVTRRVNLIHELSDEYKK